MTVAIGTYIKLLNPDSSSTGYLFQNFFQGETRTFNSENYVFGAFGFSGATLDLQAANISATLVFALSELALTIFNQAVTDRWLIELRTVWLDPDTLDETSIHSDETYAVIGLEHDTQRLSVRLGSPLDAVRQNAPRRSLTQSLVGSLPTTGDISLK
jgi:hypothetical protein